MSVATMETFTESDARLCRLMFLRGGLDGALASLMGIIAQRRPLARINAIYCTANLSMILPMGDTRENGATPATFRPPGRGAPLLMEDAIADDLIVDDLDEYKGDPLFTDPRLASVPFLEYRSLLRIALINHFAQVLLFNFWSNESHAFRPADIPVFRGLMEPLLEELLASLPKVQDVQPNRESGSTMKGLDKLKLCKGLLPVLRQVEMVAPTDYTVLIMGETGAGKEAVADAIHEFSGRCRKPLIKVNCGAIPETLLDSEMFGHAKGAFTGAFSAHAGFFEQADGGTVFLDEIGEMSLSAQTRLLRVLDQRTLRRVGGSKPVSLDIRIVAATHDDLPEKVRAGTFRKDLWYRLAGFPINVPPLRDRRSDIPALVHHFIRVKSGQLRSVEVPPSSLDLLYGYDWPGNVRELEHVVERALVFSRGRRGLRFETGGALLAAQENREAVGGAGAGWPSLLEMENRYIQAVLEHCRGKMTGKNSASDVLGIHYSTLRERMRRLGLAP